MNNLLLLIPLVICLEIFLRTELKKKITKNINIFIEIKKTLKNMDSSDALKEKTIINLSLDFFYHNIILLLNLLLIFSPFIILIVIDKIFDLTIANGFYDVYFYLMSIIVTYIYLKLKSFFNAK